MAGVEGVRGDVGDGLDGPGDGGADGVVVVEPLQHGEEHLVLRVVLDHADLLADDALLLVHALLGEVGDGDKGEENLQVLIEFLRALEVVARDGRAGEGVGAGPVGRQVLEGVAVLGVEHLVLQEVGHPRRGVPPLAVQLKAHVHAAVIGGEKGVALLKLRLLVHIDVQAVLQLCVKNPLPQPGVFRTVHAFSSLPFRK